MKTFDRNRHDLKRRAKIGERLFFVGVEADGSPVNIVERRLIKSRGDSDRKLWGVSTYWHRSHRLGGPNSMVRRILETAGVDTRQINGS